MKTWIIEPRDSLIVRDGRPFGVGAGTSATSLDFPFPSTTTGGVRTRAGLNADGIFDTSLIGAVKQIGVRGPLLVELNDDGQIVDWLLPAPSDALLMSDEDDRDKVYIKWLAPIDASFGLTNLEHEMLPVGVVKSPEGKPLADAPRYWSWKQRFNDWLLKAKDGSMGLKELESKLGHGGPEKDSRIHASLNESFTTGETGENNLFQTRGLEFRRILKEEKLKGAKRMALAVFVDDDAQAQNIVEGVAPLGGERRLVAWRDDVADASKEIRQCPDRIREEIAKGGHCRLLLLTPAFFRGGSYPERLLQKHWSGVTPKLRAFAHNRYQVVSGWDFEIDKPKPTRRLVPSGSVLFLELDGDEGKRERWVEDVWFNCISDDDSDDDDPHGQQDFRKDGFGLAVLGTWDGTTLKMEKES